ncbi:MAG: very short patch repair endonuclease, partial [Edaphobacter sp.]
QVRSFVHRLGWRFRLYRKDLPGTPDLAFPRLKGAIFIHGCFWHGHSCARGSRIPKENREYWETKIARNKERDLTNLTRLHALGWRSLIVWECDLMRRPEDTQRLIVSFLKAAPKSQAKPHRNK